MSASEINGPGSPADWRDVKAVRKIVEEEQAIDAEERARSALFRAETRSRLSRIEADQATALGLLRSIEANVVVPAAVPVAERETIAPPPSTWGEHVEAWRVRTEAWMVRQPTNRALLYGLAIAGVGATLSACAAAPLAHALLGVP